MHDMPRCELRAAFAQACMESFTYKDVCLRQEAARCPLRYKALRWQNHTVCRPDLHRCCQRRGALWVTGSFVLSIPAFLYCFYAPQCI